MILTAADHAYLGNTELNARSRTTALIPGAAEPGLRAALLETRIAAVRPTRDSSFDFRTPRYVGGDAGRRCGALPPPCSITRHAVGVTSR
jgi:hypothetical protein